MIDDTRYHCIGLDAVSGVIHRSDRKINNYGTKLTTLLRVLTSIVT